MGVYHDIDSFQDFQHLIESGVIFNYLTPRAVVQLGLCSYFIPNAIGETDANSRNIILLRDEESGKYDIVVRIDAEANTYITDRNNQRSGKKQVPKGIYRANEDLDTYLTNISRRSGDIDWDLFSSFVNLTQKLTSRSHIDNAMADAYRLNSGELIDDSPYSDRRWNGPIGTAYGKTGFFGFSNDTIERANRFLNKTASAMVGALRDVPPFAETVAKYGNTVITDNIKWNRLEQRIMGYNGEELGD